MAEDVAPRFRLSEVTLNLDEDKALLPGKVAQHLNCPLSQIDNWKIVRCGIDARRKGRVLRVYTVEFTAVDPQLILELADSDRRLNVVKAAPSAPTLVMARQPRQLTVVGMGPAGLFSALWLARTGHNVTLIERGQQVEQRVRDVETFWNDGALQPESNVQFGEGGAGTFSDGKLTTRVKDPLTRFVLQTLVEFGAPEEVLVQAKPHIGTDRLRMLLVNFRRHLLQLGVQIRFVSRLSDIHSAPTGSRRVQAITINQGEELPCDALVLAIGHSARDTYALLERKGFTLEAKPFAMGVRVEHPAQLINAIQYGSSSKRGQALHPNLSPADYSLTYNDRDSGRGTYSFCMCPGGQVVQSSSEEGMVVVNGMSDYRRAAPYSNSALVVAVRPQDFADGSPLAGVRFQQHWERRAYSAGGDNYLVPAQNMLAFLGHKGSGTQRINSSCRPGVTAVELAEVLPDFITAHLQRALPRFERKMAGFISAEATLTAIESRTSAPLRIVRDSHGQAIEWGGVYPAGEGAGYAGGIMSAAIDGIRAAVNICAG